MPSFEEIKIQGTEVVGKIKELLNDASAKKVIIKKDDHVYFEIPLHYGAGGAVLGIMFAPTLAAVGAMAALVTDISLVIEREDENVEDAKIVKTVGKDIA
jgi:Domain of unknown function (DUF4342)